MGRTAAASFSFRQTRHGVRWRTVRFPALYLDGTLVTKSREVRRCRSRHGGAPRCTVNVYPVTVSDIANLRSRQTIADEHRLFRWILTERPTLSAHGILFAPDVLSTMRTELGP